MPDIRVENRKGVAWFRPLSLDGWLWLDLHMVGASAAGVFPVPAVESGPIARDAAAIGLSVELVRNPMGA